MSLLHRREVWKFLTAICLSIAVRGSGQQPDPKLRDTVQRQVDWDNTRPDEKNPTGLQFKFAKIDEKPTATGRMVRYRAYVAGVAENKTYSLATWRIDSEAEVLPVDVYVNAKGLLMVHKPKPEQENNDSVTDDDELDLAMQAAQGEPVRFALATRDMKTMIRGTFVPFPIESRSGACLLQARLATHEGTMVLIYADGLPPKSTIPLEVVSEGDVEKETLVTNANGHAVTADMPYVDGKSAGTLKASVNAKGCSASVEISWGKGSYHYY